ncbi:MAG: hypothetical protein ACYTAN_18665 [Planctomycetota bacterium]
MMSQRWEQFRKWASVMGSAPLIALFVFAQKYIIGGIALSGMKAQ